MKLREFNSLTEAAAWISEQTTEDWGPLDLLEPRYALRPYIWIQCEPNDPRAFPFQIRDGTAAPILFVPDINRLRFANTGELTITQVAGKLYRFTPGLSFALDDVRVRHADVERLAERLQQKTVTREHKSPRGLTKQQILRGTWPYGGLESALSDLPEWLKPARVAIGKRGRYSSHLWNPALIAVCLASHGNVPKSKLDAVIRQHFPHWLAEWEASNEYPG